MSSSWPRHRLSPLTCPLFSPRRLFPSVDPEPPKVVEPEPAPPKPKPTPPKTVQPKPTPPKPKPTPRKTVQAQAPNPSNRSPNHLKGLASVNSRKITNCRTHRFASRNQPPNKPAPRIDDSKYSLPAPKLGNTSSRSTVSQSVLNAYLSQVQTKMDRVWKKLQASTDLGFGGEARLSFRVTSSGTIVSAKLTKRSGNQALDDLVLRVSRSVGNAGLPLAGNLIPLSKFHLSSTDSGNEV